MPWWERRLRIMADRAVGRILHPDAAKNYLNFDPEPLATQARAGEPDAADPVPA